MEVHTCDLCGEDIEHHADDNGRVYWTVGHNAAPLSEGRCCDSCNENVVMARLQMHQYSSNVHPHIISHWRNVCLGGRGC